MICTVCKSQPALGNSHGLDGCALCTVCYGQWADEIVNALKNAGIKAERISMTDLEILNELRSHLEKAHEWAAPEDYSDDPETWSCIKSVMTAVDDGNVGLALTRWDDLMQAPELSDEAKSWGKRP